MRIEEPGDLLNHADGSNRDQRCAEESPAWGFDGRGEQCRRPCGHGGSHYAIGHDFPSGGLAVLLWEVRPK